LQIHARFPPEGLFEIQLVIPASRESKRLYLKQRHFNFARQEAKNARCHPEGVAVQVGTLGKEFLRGA
jgi:hypothetical protein